MFSLPSHIPFMFANPLQHSSFLDWLQIEKARASVNISIVKILYKIWEEKAHIIAYLLKHELIP